MKTNTLYHGQSEAVKKDAQPRLVCAECRETTIDSHYREDENETVCEDCYTEWLAEAVKKDNINKEKTLKTAKLIKKLDDFTGDARLYKLSEPVNFEGGRKSMFVVVSATNAFMSGDETYIFPSDKDGEIKSWMELEGSFKGSQDHKLALNGAGYTFTA